MNSATILFGLLGISGVAGWSVSGRSPQIQAQMKQAWTFWWLLYPARVIPSTAHVWGVGFVILAAASVAPLALGQPLSEIGAAWLALAVIASYLIPVRLFPRWLRDEVDAGVVAAPHPSRQDWLIFWLVVAGVVLWAALDVFEFLGLDH